MKLVFISVVVALAMSACANHNQQNNANHEAHADSSAQHENAHWAYNGEEGPDKWANLCPAYAPCNGQRQSPIDLSSALALNSDVQIKRNYHCVKGMEFINNGHSVQVNFSEGDKNLLNVNGVDFELKQFHFHSPSEHTMDGVHYDGEAHFVHVSADGQISVVGVFMKLGAENELIKHIISFIPEKAGEKVIVNQEVCPNAIFSDHDAYYIYEGSLTTPPCTEGVNWFVRKEAIEVSAAQLDALKKAMPANNARPVQATHEREFGKLDK